MQLIKAVSHTYRMTAAVVYDWELINWIRIALGHFSSRSSWDLYAHFQAHLLGQIKETLDSKLLNLIGMGINEFI